QDCGVKAIFIHGRDRQQFYKGMVDYKIIKDVKKSVSIPVIASGDIWSAIHAKKMFDETGCDGILVARGALGNPWIFKEIDQYFSKHTLPEPPSINETIDTLLHHLDLSIAEHGEKSAVPIMRKFAGWYFKGRKFVRPLRLKINPVKTREEYHSVVLSLREK
ncbi:MAG TPA: tRNA-dihydrouridine synthase, partial [Candidatus Omnitrophota bacterium]|nr:tRNA-dihydrouridine synthase [Candidatus Omnitrophota bacterium]